MLSFRLHGKNQQVIVVATRGNNGPLCVDYPAGSGSAARAGHALAAGLSAMLGRATASRESPAISGRRLVISGADREPARRETAAGRLVGDSFTITPAGPAIEIAAGSDRGLLHGAHDLLESLGASFDAWRAPDFPPIAQSDLNAIAPRAVTPAFDRRAIVSDIMTWHYDAPDRLAEHLVHDRLFTSWMAARGLNAFLFIRHARDSRLRIDELAPILDAGGIDAEYGGHVLELLMPRALYADHPEYFPADSSGARRRGGNLCVSNTAALARVRDEAAAWIRDFPENRMLHVWGADLWDGGWCRCGQCADLSPQLQYMAAVNAVAATGGLPVAYLAYHDTLEPDPRLRPHENVWFEWAPRERCYAHAINDPACERNCGYFAWLRRYVDLFDGRGMVFEYYADAILFGGLGFATPDIIVRDLAAYHALGIRSISCLTFGAFSVLAYPINLETFARAARSLELQTPAPAERASAQRHRDDAREMTQAYRCIERASRLVLTYGDVMRPFMNGEASTKKQNELRAAAGLMARAAEAADAIAQSRGDSMAAAERDLWRFSTATLSALGDYMAARARPGYTGRDDGHTAIARVEAALGIMRSVSSDLKGTWGRYDIERFHKLWIEGLRRRLEPPVSAEVPDEPPA
jgi:hypothetical protein